MPAVTVDDLKSVVALLKRWKACPPGDVGSAVGKCQVQEILTARHR